VQHRGIQLIDWVQTKRIILVLSLQQAALREAGYQINFAGTRSANIFCQQPGGAVGNTDILKGAA